KWVFLSKKFCFQKTENNYARGISVFLYHKQTGRAFLLGGRKKTQFENVGGGLRGGKKTKKKGVVVVEKKKKVNKNKKKCEIKK
ncbi:hypothetical protein AP221_26560, partial [Escherichia coli]|uniref:hypothetical protein n=1 Tax=Escherichia coli TaxID=562 RepID=UPI000910BC7A